MEYRIKVSQKTKWIKARCINSNIKKKYKSTCLVKYREISLLICQLMQSYISHLYKSSDEFWIMCAVTENLNKRDSVFKFYM